MYVIGWSTVCTPHHPKLLRAFAAIFAFPKGNGNACKAAEIFEKNKVRTLQTPADVFINLSYPGKNFKLGGELLAWAAPRGVEIQHPVILPSQNLSLKVLRWQIHWGMRQRATARRVHGLEGTRCTIAFSIDSILKKWNQKWLIYDEKSLSCALCKNHYLHDANTENYQ